MPNTRRLARQARKKRSLSQRLRAGWRDTVVLFREFGPLLAIFAIVVLALTLSFWLLWNQTPGLDDLRFFETLYFIMAMLFFQPTLDFPDQWYLDLYFFAAPLIGLIFLALGVADFAVLLFNRRSRQSQWEEAVASTYRGHTVICGLGKVGIRVVRELVVLGEDVVAIDVNLNGEHVEEVRDYGIPVIQGDARNEDNLRKAGLPRAAAVIVCTNNDLINLQIATRLRELNDQARIVLRLFEDQFGQSIAEGLRLSAVLSASSMATPAFVGAATRTEIVQTFPAAGRLLNLGRLEVEPGSRLEGVSLRVLEDELDLAVVLLQSDGQVDVTPPPEAVLRGGDRLYVVAELPALRAVAREMLPAPESHIIVCGLGNVGLRVARQLFQLDEPVVILEKQQLPEKLAEVRRMGYRMVGGDARSEEALREAGIDQAAAVIVCTNNDLLNLQIATRIRELNPRVRIVLRMFEDQFGQRLTDGLRVSAVLSASGLAAPAFVGAATRTEIVQSFSAAGRELHLCRIEVEAGSRAQGASVQQIEDALDLSVVLLQSDGLVDVAPSRGVRLQAADRLYVVAELAALRTLSTEWNRKNPHGR